MQRIRLHHLRQQHQRWKDQSNDLSLIKYILNAYGIKFWITRWAVHWRGNEIKHKDKIKMLHYTKTRILRGFSETTLQAQSISELLVYVSVDTIPNSCLRAISRTIKSTPIQWMSIFSQNIAIKHQGRCCTDTWYWKQSRKYWLAKSWRHKQHNMK